MNFDGDHYETYSDHMHNTRVAWALIMLYFELETCRAGYCSIWKGYRGHHHSIGSARRMTSDSRHRRKDLIRLRTSYLRP